MIEVFRQAEEGRLSLTDSIAVVNSFKSIVDGSSYEMDVGEDSDAEVYKALGKKATIEWLVQHMIAASSNLATNILIDLVKADSVQATIERLGTTKMHVYRGVEDLKAYEQGLNNTATSADLATLMTALARGRAVSDSADARMVDIMATQEFNTMIPSGLPRGTRVAHKTGSITRIHHDAAIVYPEGQDPYVLVILTEGIEDRKESSGLGANIAGLVNTMMGR
jgi:beta-lactamase class A